MRKTGAPGRQVGGGANNPGPGGLRDGEPEISPKYFWADVVHEGRMNLRSERSARSQKIKKARPTQRDSSLWSTLKEPASQCKAVPFITGRQRASVPMHENPAPC